MNLILFLMKNVSSEFTLRGSLVFGNEMEKTDKRMNFLEKWGMRKSWGLNGKRGKANCNFMPNIT